MSVVSRTFRADYGTWSSTDAGWRLHQGYDGVDTTADFSYSFVAICTAANPAELKTRTDAFKTALDTPNQRALISFSSENVVDLDPRTSAYTAQSAAATYSLVEEPRSDRVVAYEVTISGAKVASQEADKLGRRSTEFRVAQSPEGVRSISATIVYTPLPDVDGSPASAYEVATNVDQSLGIEAVFSKYLTTTLGESEGNWDRGAPQFNRSSEDDRFVTATLTRQQLIYPQGDSDSPLSDPRLVNAVYACATNREAAESFADLEARSTTLVRCEFRSGVIVSQSQDLDAMIYTVALPAIKARVRQVLRASGTLYMIRNGLRADPQANQIAGSVDFMGVAEATLVSASKIYQDQKSTGKVVVPVLNGSDYDVDVHEGPKIWVRTVILAVNEIADLGTAEDSYTSPVLVGLRDSEVELQEDGGFVLLGEDPVAQQVTRKLPGETGFGVLRSSVALRFRRANVLGTESEPTTFSSVDPGSRATEEVETAESL